MTIPLFLKRSFVLFVICIGFYLLGNNLVSLTDPDEVFYSLTAHEMTAKNEWLTPLIFGQPQFEKPPLTYWLLEIAFKTWGESPFSARFFPALFAGFGVLGLYVLGLLGFKDERKAFLSAVVLASAGLYIGMAKTVFTDMVFTVFILLALLMFVLSFTDRRRQDAGTIGFYVFCALATLTKSPLGFVIPQLAVILFLLYQRRINFLLTWFVPIGLLIFLIISAPWYIVMFDQYGGNFIREFFYNDHWRRLIMAEHRANDHWFFYFVTMIAGLFPWSLFLLASWVDLFKRLKSSVTLIDYLTLSWVFACLLVFQMAHSKLASYILPLFPALALMTGNFLGNCLSQIQDRKKLQNLLWASFAILCILGVAVMGAHKVISPYLSSLLPAYFLSAALIVLAGSGMTLVIKERFQAALLVLAFSLAPIFLTAFMVRADVEGYVSSKEASEYIPKTSVQKMTVLTTKANARGIRYYSGQDVAVVDFSGKPFFSPHPIPILTTADQILHILKQQPVTIGVIGKSAYQDILKNCSRTHHVALLRVIGRHYVVRIEPVLTQ